MLVRTEAIVLSRINYSENSIIASMYTQASGLQQFIVRGVRKSGARVKLNLFQPLSAVEVIYLRKERTSLQTIREIKPACLYNTIPFDIKKSTVCMFLAEVLAKVIREQEQNLVLFSFIRQALTQFDEKTGTTALFHCWFLSHLIRFIGFSPCVHYNRGDVFDLQEGLFTAHAPIHGMFMPASISHWFYEASTTPFDAFSLSQIPANQRKALRTGILDFYFWHIPNMGKIKSLQILEEVFA